MDPTSTLRRNTASLENKNFDLLVVGGGIYGACVAWDAAMRGLEVALVEKADFGGATSANSLKTIHGGLRYLQDASVRLIRTMIAERKTWMRIAPHLVHPLACLMPTAQRELRRHKLVLAAALSFNDLLGFDRNQGMDEQKHLPAGRIVSEAEYARLAPEILNGTATGGAIWHDAQAHNTERLLLSILLSAAGAGAVVANYVEVTCLLQDGPRVIGAGVQDGLSGRELEVRAKLVVNATGGWTDALLDRLEEPITGPKFRRSIAVNLVTRRITTGEYALAIPSKYVSQDNNGRQVERSRLLFAVPWRSYSLIGTLHFHYAGPTIEHPVDETIVQSFIDEINEAVPSAALTRQDVYQVHAGYLPSIEDGRYNTKVKLVREGRIHDHEQEDRVKGIITVVGVKYTTARHMAEKAVDLAMRKLGRADVPCQTHMTPISGGQIGVFDDFLAKAISRGERSLPAETIRHLVYNYGANYQQILAHIDENRVWGRPLCDEFPVIGAEVIHTLRCEMAVTLADVVFRRTELGMAGLPCMRCLQTCAELVAAELEWDPSRTQHEIDSLIQGSKQTGKRLVIG